MQRPDDVSQEAWDAAKGVAEPINSGAVLHDLIIEGAARAIMAARAEALEEAARHIEARGEELFVNYGEKASDYLCQDLAAQLRARK